MEKNMPFLDLNVYISKTVGNTSKVTK